MDVPAGVRRWGERPLSFYLMQAKMEVALAKERESLAEARATISSQKVTMEERIKATEESTKRIAMDDFMAEFRVEERSYARESRSLNASKKSMVMQERLFFRNIPLSNWIEHEMVVEEGRDLDQLPKESVFTAGSIAPAESRVTMSDSLLPMSESRPSSSEPRLPISIAEGRVPISKMLDEIGAQPQSKQQRDARQQRDNAALIPSQVVAFGAQ